MTAQTPCPSCQAELRPTDRFCSACGAPRPMYCGACGEVLAPQARFCGQCGTKVESGSEQRSRDLPSLDAPALASPPVPQEPEAPAALREKFDAVRSELQGDRREVVVLFADLSGFTAMSEAMDPEAVTILMNRLLQALAHAVYEYEGYVDKFIGDAVMALFGAPLAHEDDPERAVLAALRMQEVVARHNATSDVPLALRVGINVGEVVAAYLGPNSRMQYTVLGDTVNVASRLEGVAEVHTVLVSEAVYRRVSHYFDAVEVPPLTLKGKADPVRAFQIGSARETREAAGFAETPFVGREQELGEVGGWLAELRSGQPGSLLIEAEAGGGKTRLVEEALTREGSGLSRIILRFTSVRLPGQRPPASELFHQLFSSGSGDPVENAMAALGRERERHRTSILGLSDPIDSGDAAEAQEEADPAVARQNRWIAIAALLQAACRRKPLVLWLEDVHWLDEAGEEFLAYLLQAVARHPIGVVITGRPVLTGAWIPTDVRRLSLTPLDEEAARAMLGDIADDIGVEQRRDLIRRSQGNPLYLEQLARSLRETGGSAGVPGTLQGLIMARIDRLERSLQTLLQMAAVLGARFPGPLLRRMYGLDPERLDFDAAIRGISDAGFLTTEDPERKKWEFRHALTQEVVYGGLLVRMRKVLHESAARLGEEVFGESLEAEAPFFAHHYWEAGILEEAAPHLWTAGQTAAESYELPAAERYLDRLTEAVKAGWDLLTGEEKARFLEMHGNVLLHRGRLEDADMRFRELEKEGEHAGRAEWTARGLEYRGRTAWYRGELDAAEDLFERGLERLPPSHDRIEADLHNDLGIVYYYRGRPDDAFAQHLAALDLRKKLSDRLGLAKSHTNIGNLFADFRGDLVSAEEQYRLAQEMAESVGDRQMQYSALFNLATIMQDRGKRIEAIDIFRKGERLLEEIGWGHARYQNLLKQAESEIALGQIDRALRHLHACLSRGDAVLEPVNRINARTFLFDAYLRACADDTARQAIADARRMVDELQIDEALESVLLREGVWHAARGRWKEAAGVFGEAVEEARRRHHNSFAALAEAHRCRALVRAGVDSVESHFAQPLEQAPLLAVIDYLHADASAVREPNAKTAAALERVADEAARLGDPGLERAAAERLAQVWLACGNEDAHARAIERAARAMVAIEEGLSKDLAEGFAAHPRNALLRQMLEAGAPRR